jgi:hypothetical protein
MLFTIQQHPTLIFKRIYHAIFVAEGRVLKFSHFTVNSFGFTASPLNYGNDTWWRNTAMEELHMKHETPPSWYFETGTDITDLPTKCKLYVPYTDGWKYSSTNRNNWSKYFSIQYVYE